MRNLKNRKKNSSKVTTTSTATLLLLGTILIVTSVSTPLASPIHLLQSAEAQSFIETGTDFVVEPKAPAVVSGDNIYVAWWTNNTENGNEEVMFRASTDGGATFSNRTNLSNTTDADSIDAEIAAEGDTVIVTWWERNQTSNVPVARLSNDAGVTFGPLLMLGMNGTVSGVEEAAAAEEEGEGEEEEEEAAAAEGVIEEAIGGP